MAERAAPRAAAGNPRITAIIVDYRKAERVLRGVASLQRQYDPDLLDIAVIDNSECPRNAALLRELAGRPNVTLTVSPTNLGYTAGCNAAAAGCRGDYVLLLNPDIFWHEAGALRRLVAFMEARPAAAVAGLRQVDEDGTTPLTARRFPTLPAQVLRRTALRGTEPFAGIVAAYEAPGFDYRRTQTADWLQSSCMLIRRDFWDRIGGLDQRFFLFMADCDICLSAWRQGLEVWHFGEAAVTADGVRASAGGFLRLFRSTALRRHVADAFRYYWKHSWVADRSRLKPRAIRGAAPGGSALPYPRSSEGD